MNAQGAYAQVQMGAGQAPFGLPFLGPGENPVIWGDGNISKGAGVGFDGRPVGNSPLETLFGTIVAPQQPGSYNRSLYTAPETYSARLPQIEHVLIDVLRLSDSPWITKIMPLIKVSGIDGVAFKIRRYNTHIMTRRAPFGPPRTVSTRTEEGVSLSNYYNIGAEFEDHHFLTPQGQKHFAFTIQQIINSIVTTLELMVIVALCHHNAPAGSQREAKGMGLTYTQLCRLVDNEVLRTGSVQKMALPFDFQYNEVRQIMESRGIDPSILDTFIIPRGSINIAARHPFLVHNLTSQGDGLPDAAKAIALHDNMARPVSGMKYIEFKRIKVEEGNSSEEGEFEDPSSRRVAFGTYFRGLYEESGYGPNYTSGDRTIWVWDENTKNHEPIDLKTLLRHSGLFMSDTADHDFTGAGTSYFSAYGTLWDYLVHSGTSQQVLEALNQPAVRPAFNAYYDGVVAGIGAPAQLAGGGRMYRYSPAQPASLPDTESKSSGSSAPSAGFAIDPTSQRLFRTIGLMDVYNGARDPRDWVANNLQLVTRNAEAAEAFVEKMLPALKQGLPAGNNFMETMYNRYGHTTGTSAELTMSSDGRQWKDIVYYDPSNANETNAVKFLQAVTGNSERKFTDDEVKNGTASLVSALGGNLWPAAFLCQAVSSVNQASLSNLMSAYFMPVSATDRRAINRPVSELVLAATYGPAIGRDIYTSGKWVFHGLSPHIEQLAQPDRKEAVARVVALYTDHGYRMAKQLESKTAGAMVTEITAAATAISAAYGNIDDRAKRLIITLFWLAKAYQSRLMEMAEAKADAASAIRNFHVFYNAGMSALRDMLPVTDGAGPEPDEQYLAPILDGHTTQLIWQLASEGKTSKARWDRFLKSVEAISVAVGQDADQYLKFTANKNTRKRARDEVGGGAPGMKGTDLTGAMNSRDAVREGLMRLPLVNGSFFFWCEANNVPCPLSFLVFQPHSTYRMCMTIAMKTGQETAHAMWEYIRTHKGATAIQKKFILHTDAHFGTAVTNPYKIVRIYDTSFLEYIGGGDSSLWPTTRRAVSAYKNQNKIAAFSCFVVAVPPNMHSVKPVIDITGHFTPGLCKRIGEMKLPHYPSAYIYKDLWGWTNDTDGHCSRLEASCYASDDPDEVMGQSNTVLLQGSQFYIQKGTRQKTRVLGRGHIGDRPELNPHARDGKLIYTGPEPAVFHNIPTSR